MRYLDYFYCVSIINKKDVNWRRSLNSWMSAVHPPAFPDSVRWKLVFSRQSWTTGQLGLQKGFEVWKQWVIVPFMDHTQQS